MIGPLGDLPGKPLRIGFWSCRQILTSFPQNLIFKITSEQLLNGFEHYLKTQKWMKDLLLPLRLPLIHAQTHMPRYTPA